MEFLLSFSRKTHRGLAGSGARRGGIAPSGEAFQVEVVGSAHNVEPDTSIRSDKRSSAG